MTDVARPAPLVSVCIANYNGREVLEACLASVRAQSGGLDVEIIIHDDASPDGSSAIVRTQFPEAVLIESAENVGFCVANNRMAEAARGEYLLLLNNDAELLPDALATLLAEARRLAGPAILSLPQFDAASGALIDRGCLLDPFFNPVPNLDPASQDVAMVIGACLWIPRSLWRELGGFPAWFGSLAEDMYLCCRARLAGYPVRVAQESGYRHRVGQSFGGGKVTAEHRLVTTRRRRALSERNKTFVMILTCPAPLFYLLLPLHCLLLLLEGAVLVLLKGEWALFRDVYLGCLAAVWRERRRLFRLRREGRREVGGFFRPFVWLPHKLTLLLRHGVPEIR